MGKYFDMSAGFEKRLSQAGEKDEKLLRPLRPQKPSEEHVRKMSQIIERARRTLAGIETNLAQAREKEEKEQPILGHSFIGYRRETSTRFVAVFKDETGELTFNKKACEQRLKDSEPGEEIREATKMALAYWPRIKN